jgi:hypothetical protein
MEFHWNILDKKRKGILPLFRNFSNEGFYLAGGTGLALLIGHRDSNDFDFFKADAFDTADFIEKLKQIFKEHKFSITQLHKNTISCEIDDTIQLSFFSYNYELLKPVIKTEYFEIASMEDIACMKLSAIASRNVEKDYVDLYFIAHLIPLKDLISYCLEKYPSFNEIVILKSLPYIKDVKREHIIFKENHSVSLEKIKNYFEEAIRVYMKEKQENDIRESKRGKNVER